MRLESIIWQMNELDPFDLKEYLISWIAMLYVLYIPMKVKFDFNKIIRAILKMHLLVLILL